MANEFETPAEREAKINAANARINEAIAEDVAAGMAEKADHERHRANAYAAGNARLQRETDNAQFNRIHAEHQAAEARRDANNSKFGFWLLASFLAVVLFVGSMWWANRNPNETATASSASQPPVVTRTVVVSPSPSPAVVREVVPVAVPVPVQVAPPGPTQQQMQQQPMQGYTKPQQRSMPSPAPTLAPMPQETPPSRMVPSDRAPSTESSSSSSSSDQPLGGYIER